MRSRWSDWSKVLYHICSKYIYINKLFFILVFIYFKPRNMLIEITKDGGLGFFWVWCRGWGRPWVSVAGAECLFDGKEESKDGSRCQYWWREENQSACVFYCCRGDDWCKVWRLVVMAATMRMWGVVCFIEKKEKGSKVCWLEVWLINGLSFFL